MKNNLWVIAQQNLPPKVKDASNNINKTPHLTSMDKADFYRISGNQEINTDFLLNQLRIHISSMDNNSRVLECLNKKFISFQQE